MALSLPFVLIRLSTKFKQKWSYKIIFQVKAFKVDGQDSYTAEMHLAVHDARELPIGWSSWQPKFGKFKVILQQLPNF